jgi:hypothetical protein
MPGIWRASSAAGRTARVENGPDLDIGAPPDPASPAGRSRSAARRPEVRRRVRTRPGRRQAAVEGEVRSRRLRRRRALGAWPRPPARCTRRMRIRRSSARNRVNRSPGCSRSNRRQAQSGGSPRRPTYASRGAEAPPATPASRHRRPRSTAPCSSPVVRRLAPRVLVRPMARCSGASTRSASSMTVSGAKRPAAARSRAPAPSSSDGRVVVNSGYLFGGRMPGNVLLVFSVRRPLVRRWRGEPPRTTKGSR